VLLNMTGHRCQIPAAVPLFDMHFRIFLSVTFFP
jgi:hypothetical protein